MSRDYRGGRDPAPFPPHPHFRQPHPSSSPTYRKSPHRQSSLAPYHARQQSPGRQASPSYRRRSRSPPRHFGSLDQPHSLYLQGQIGGNDLGDPPQTPSCDPVPTDTPLGRKEAEVKGEDVFGAKEERWSNFNLEDVSEVSVWETELIGRAERNRLVVKEWNVKNAQRLKRANVWLLFMCAILFHFKQFSNFLVAYKILHTYIVFTSPITSV